MTTAYIFGYGSLISDEAREHTGTTTAPCAVYVKNLLRMWSAFAGAHYCPLGIREQDGAVTGGVLFKILPEYQEEFDAREQQYIRTSIPQDAIEFPDRAVSLEGETIEVYLPPRVTTPTTDCPLIQSYIDVTISGCLHYSEEFARHFIRNTDDWESPWIDDRKTPLYPRRLKDTSNALYQTIDALLSESDQIDLSKRIPLNDYKVSSIRNAETYE